MLSIEDEFKYCDMDDCLEDAVLLPALKFGGCEDWVGWCVCQTHYELFQAGREDFVDEMMKRGIQRGAPREDVELIWIPVEKARSYF